MFLLLVGLGPMSVVPETSRLCCLSPPAFCGFRVHSINTSGRCPRALCFVCRQEWICLETLFAMTETSSKASHTSHLPRTKFCKQLQHQGWEGQSQNRETKKHVPSMTFSICSEDVSVEGTVSTQKHQRNASVGFALRSTHC